MKNNNDGGYEQSDDEYFASMIPAGYRFKPTDEELVTGYLIKNINNERLPLELIHVVNKLYEFDPENLADSFFSHPQRGLKHWEKMYGTSFYPRSEKHIQSSSPNRDVVDGFWMAVDYEKPIEHSGKEIAYRIPFVFVRGIMKTDWMMDEFRVKCPQPLSNQ